MENKRNNSIEMMRLFAAVLIVGIHTAPFYELNATIGFIATEVITRIAVPFFFLVSGYYYSRSRKTFWNIFLQYLIPYLWISAVYFICDYIITNSGALNTNTLISYLDGKKLSFLVFGSWYHLWFFPAVMIALTVFEIAKRLKLTHVLAYISVVLYIIGVLCCAYQKLFTSYAEIEQIVKNPYFEAIRRIFLMGLPFFGLGFFVDDCKEAISKHLVPMRDTLIVLLILVGLWVTEIVLVKKFDLYDNIVLTFFLYPLIGYIMVLLLMNPNEKNVKMGEYSKITSKYMYYFHPLLFLLIPGVKKLPNTVCFMITVVIFLGIGFCVFLCGQRIRNHRE